MVRKGYCFLGGEFDVDESSDGLDWATVLGMVEEVADAR